MDINDQNSKNAAAAELGRLGGQKTAERGPEYYAKIQALRKTRSGGRPPNPKKATHKGVLKIGSTELPVFVLEDGTRVISGRGMTAAIGMKGRGQGTARISSLLKQKSNADSDLVVAIESPLVFDSGAPLPTQGYEASILVSVCEAILDARDEGRLGTKEEFRYADACKILSRAFSKLGIIALVDEATGYQEVRDRLALQAILDRFLLKELAAWAKRFPDEFYQQIFRLRGWEWKGMSINRPGIVARYTNDLVYERLAPGILEELQARNPRDEHGRRKHRHHQWLTEDVGHPALAQHLYALIGFMRVSSDWDQFYHFVQRAYPKRGQNLMLPLDDAELGQ